jgi:squalene-associated FAD-dependent desaturase
MKSIAIIGGGVAGLAAGCALAEIGYKVALFERKPYMGGRASSYEHPGTGEVVDNCQHVLLGCCTNLIDFYRRIGSEQDVQWFDTLTFMTPGGKQSQLKPSALPAPSHSSIAFLKTQFLSWSDKLAISRGLAAMMREPLPDTGESFLTWLRQHGQTDQAIRRFWEPVLVSALNEDLDRCSVRYASLVFRDSFLKSAHAGEMGVPAVPLTELYSRAKGYIEERGGTVRLRTSVEQIASGREEVQLTLGLEGKGEEFAADSVIVAVPWHVTAKLVPTLAAQLSQIESSSITGIHLWFDRRITDLPHAVLLDRTIQWMFHKSLLQPKRGEQGSYVELVVSASKKLIDMSRQEIIDLAVKELGEFFPAVHGAKLKKATVVKEFHATYSVLPGADALRPKQATSDPRLFLAGDWTDTGWPATMEGAVRSGYLAAEAIAGKKILVPDLPARGLMKMFG